MERGEGVAAAGSGVDGPRRVATAGSGGSRRPEVEGARWLAADGARPGGMDDLGVGSGRGSGFAIARERRAC